MGGGSVNVNANISTGGGLSISALPGYVNVGAVTISGPANITAPTGFVNLTDSDFLTGLTVAGAHVVMGGGLFQVSGGDLNITGGLDATFTGLTQIAGNLNVSIPAVISIGGISATGTQHYFNTVKLMSNTVLTGSTVQFDGLLSNSGGDFALVINGNALFNGGVALTTVSTPTSSLRVNGSSTFNSSPITVDGSQFYQGDVSLNADVNFSGTGDVFFGGRINGPFNLLSTVSGQTSINNIIGGIVPLASLTITNEAKIVPISPVNLNITTTGSQNYLGGMIFELAGLNSTVNFSGGTINIAGPITLPPVPGLTALINGAIPSLPASFSGTADVTFVIPMPSLPPPLPPEVVVPDLQTVVAQLQTNTLDQSQCGVGDPACASAQNNQVVSNQSEGKVEILVEDPIPKTVAGTVSCMMGFATAIDSSGSERILLPGDKIYMNEKVVTDEMSRVKIQFNTGRTVEVPSSDQYTVQRQDSNVF